LIPIKIAIRGAPAAGRDCGFARGWAEIRASMAFPASAAHLSAVIEIESQRFHRTLDALGRCAPRRRPHLEGGTTPFKTPVGNVTTN